MIFSPDILNLLARVISIIHTCFRHASSRWGAEREEEVCARELSREFSEFGLELVVHDKDSELGALCIALGLGKGLKGTFDVRLQLAHGIANCQAITY